MTDRASELSSTQDEFFSNTDNAGLPLLDGQIIDRGNAFLDRVNTITPIPELSFSDSTSVFVFVPMYREYENVERLYESWIHQQVPKEVQAEVVFLVNNSQNAPSDVVRNNRLTYDFLRAAISGDHEGSSIRFHVIDRFSEGSALPNGASMADIRNVAISPIIRHLLRVGANAVILSTDADCFPSENVIAALNTALIRQKSMYGYVERELEYPVDMSSEERRQIEKLFLIPTTEAILLEYLSYGEWPQFNNSMAGSNTFYTADKFLDVDGYTSDPSIYEDADLGEKLSRLAPYDSIVLEGCSISNQQRYSDRVDGDGLLFQKARDEENSTSFHAETTIGHARLRRWLIQALATSENMADGVGNKTLSLVRLTQILHDLGIEDVADVFIPIGGSLEDVYEGVYKKAINKIYAQRYNIIDSLKSYDALIIQILGEDEKYMEIVRRLKNRGVNKDEILHIALQLYVTQ